MKLYKIIAGIVVSTIILFGATQINNYEKTLDIKKIEIDQKSETIQELESAVDAKATELNKALESLETSDSAIQELQDTKDALEAKQKRLEAELQAKARRKAEQSGRNIAYADKPTTVKVVGNKQAWLAASNIPRSDWQYADYIIQKESGWRYDVWNGSGSSAYGLCQTMTSIHKPPQSFYSDPVEQLNWCNNYAQKYGGWAGSYSFWLDNHWW